MEESLTTLLRRIEQINCKVAAQDREVIAVGSFQALIDPSCNLTWLNYAVPVEPLGADTEVSEVLVELREVFAERDRILRFEFTESLWPRLPELLVDNGFTVEAHHPMMLCTPADFQPYQTFVSPHPKSLSLWKKDFEDLLATSCIQVEYLTAADDIETLTTYLSVRNQGFDYHADEPPTKQEIAELSEQIQQGRMRCALARLEGIPAGIGVMMSMFGIAELAGVATIPALRRRGVAATLCSVLVKDHFQAGGELVWLSAGDEIAQATYERIGFRVVDTRLNYIDVTVKEYKHY